MEENKFQVFIREDCSICQELVSFMNNNKLNVDIVNVVTKEGFGLSEKHEIMKLPTVLLLDNKNKAVDRLYTLYELQKLLKL